MEKGSIVLIGLPQSDGSYKTRPAVLLKKIAPYNDWLLCIISTKIQNQIKRVDILVDESHPDFRNTRLKTASLIRVAMIYTIPLHSIQGKIGSVSNNTYDTIISNFISYIQSA
jgi:mRNA interferase MazF